MTEPDQYGLIQDGGIAHPTKPAKARVAVGIGGHGVLLDIDLPDDYKEGAGFAWDDQIPLETPPGLYDVEIDWMWDSEWDEMSGTTYHHFFIKSVKWPNGLTVSIE